MDSEPTEIETDSEPTELEKDLTEVINNVFNLMRKKGIIKVEAKTRDLKISKVILNAKDSHEDIAPMDSVDDLSADSQFYLNMIIDDLENENVSGYFNGKFYIQQDYSIVPLVQEETAANISLDQMENSDTISLQAMSFLEEHWEKIWEVIILAIKVYILVKTGVLV